MSLTTNKEKLFKKVINLYIMLNFFYSRNHGKMLDAILIIDFQIAVRKLANFYLARNIVTKYQYCSNYIESN